MVKLEDAVIARLRTHGKTFEVLVDPELAFKLRQGESDINLEDLLAVEEVFTDASKGERASEEDLNTIFGTKDALEVAKKIIEKGDIQITAEQRRRMIEERRRQVVTIISRNAINPQTGAPHPPARIEKAMEEAGVHIDLHKSLDELVNEVLKAIRPIIPIRFEEIKIAFKVPPQYVGKCIGTLRNFGEIEREEWGSDGSWMAIIRMPAGLQNEFYETLNKLTHGEGETRLLK
jgi:ribosome maturation protein SDO1